MIIREVTTSDAENLLYLIQDVEASSKYMLLEPGERNVTREQHMNMVENIVKSDNSTILVAENNQELIGYVMTIGGRTKRNKHSAYIVIGIVDKYRGNGIGTKLFEEITNWAADHGIYRLELTVVTENEAGVALYKKIGFEIEGVKRNSLLIDGQFVDEYYMSKLID